MRFLLIAILLSGCAAMQHEEKAFMQHDAIVAQIKAPAEQMDMQLSGEALEREKMTIDIDLFFDLEMQTVGTEKSVKNSVPVGDVDLRYRDTPIKKQWNGTCSAFAGVAALENTLGGDLHLSERDAWHWYRKYSCRAFINAISEKRICKEKDWPQSKTSPYKTCAPNRRVKLDRFTYLKDDIGAAVQHLQKGRVVYLGMTTPRDMLSCKAIIRPNTGGSRGGHALAIVGYKKASETSPAYFILKNSWGPSCGDKGYHYLPTSVCQRRDLYCIMWSIEEVSNEEPDDVVCKKIKVCKRVWYAPWKKRCYWKETCE